MSDGIAEGGLAVDRRIADKGVRVDAAEVGLDVTGGGLDVSCGLAMLW